MTKQRAKKLTLEVWRYLRDHPKITRKHNLPDKLYEKIEKMECECPLCAIFSNCGGCPLDGCATPPKNYYGRWVRARTQKVRQSAATEIVKLVEAWNIRRRYK